MTLRKISHTSTVTSAGAFQIKSSTTVHISSDSAFHPAVLLTTIHPTTTPTVGPTRLFVLPPPTSVSVSITPLISTSTPPATFIAAPMRPTVATFSSYPLGQAEETSGTSLQDDEKPKILAIIAEDINSGLPTKNILILKRLTSRNRFSENEYKILRKNVFQSGSMFETIKHISASFNSISDDLYNIISSSVSPAKDDIFTVEDTSLLSHTSYVYKLELDFDIINITRFST